MDPNLIALLIAIGLGLFALGVHLWPSKSIQPTVTAPAAQPAQPTVTAPSTQQNEEPVTTEVGMTVSSATTRLEQKSPVELQEIAARYNLKITGKAGNTWERILYYVASMLLFSSAILIGISLIPVPVWLRLTWAGASIILFVAIFTKTFYLVSVPKLIGALAKSRFGGRVHVFTAGWNIKFPWEEVTVNDYLTLRSGVTSEEVSAPTADKVVVTFKEPMLRWRVFPPLLLVNTSHSTDTIDRGATEIFESVVSEQVSKFTIDELPSKLTTIQLDLEKALENPEHPVADDRKHQDVHGSTFEEQYGLIAEIIALGAPSLPTDYKEAMEGKVTINIYHQTALQMVKDSAMADSDGKPTITYAQALENVMINAKEGITKDIRVFRVEFDENTRHAASNFGSNLGPAIASVASAFSGRGQRGNKPNQKGTSK